MVMVLVLAILGIGAFADEFSKKDYETPMDIATAQTQVWFAGEMEKHDFSFRQFGITDDLWGGFAKSLEKEVIQNHPSSAKAKFSGYIASAFNVDDTDTVMVVVELNKGKAVMSWAIVIDK